MQTVFLKDNAFDRGDYRELVSLTLLYLNADNYENNLKHPGALHHARWMSKLLYSIKMNLLGDKIINELPKGSIFCRNQRNLIHRFIPFIIYCYVPWWLTAPISSSAPENDLHLINSIIHKEMRDPVISNAALACLKNHMWYLTEEMLPLALF